MNSTEHKVRQLCARVIAADDTEFHSALVELRTYLRSHSEILRNAAMASMLALSQSEGLQQKAQVRN